MRFRVTFKTPDALEDAIWRAIDEESEGCDGDDPHEVESAMDGYAKDIRDACAKWVRYGESITVEFDMEAGTCTVVETGR